MKKKFYIYIALFTAFALALPSCMNLDEEVLDEIPSSNFGRNEAEINAIMAPAYKTFNRYWSHNFMSLQECTGDMMLIPSKLGGDWYDGGQYRELHMHTWVATNNTIRGSWNRATECVSACNLILHTIEENQSMEAGVKTRSVAELRGIRAFWYYVMLDNWGNIPLVTDFTNTELPSLTPRNEAYQFVLKELNEIKDILRDDVSTASYGKFTKGAAYALLAKMYLNAEAWGVDSPRWQEVVNACDVVMGLDYRIEPVWKDNFKAANETSLEAVLAAAFSANESNSAYRMVYYNWLHYLDNIALGFRGTGNNCMTAQPDYVRLFDEEDQRFAGSFLLGPMINPATGQVLITAHSRPLIHTIDVTIIPGTERDGTPWGDVNQEDGARIFKWEYEKSIINMMENDFHIIRLADIYLMKAEALVRLGQDNGEATRLVNVIRERGYGNDSHNYTSVTLKEVELERKLELAWEFWARQDNIRFGTFQNPRWLKQSTAGKDYLNIFPIPQTAWQANNKLVQNPGYPAFN
ncbi:MAG: RagB/SusD family nutrient uptake outer membrane protein [Tannerella sp.]|jgi:hypothetical protein|nr:RagB/SusD family nutrient uptake outer membrane protein [Tannerella sp.]